MSAFWQDFPSTFLVKSKVCLFSAFWRDFPFNFLNFNFLFPSNYVHRFDESFASKQFNFRLHMLQTAWTAFLNFPNFSQLKFFRTGTFLLQKTTNLRLKHSTININQVDFSSLFVRLQINTSMNVLAQAVRLRLISYCLISDYLASFCNDAIFRLLQPSSSLFAQMLLILY